MADNKKSFILYCDIINTVEKLPDKEAGKLFKHLLNYVNYNNPETDDLLVDVAFEPIKQQLKRDLEKYEHRCKANKTNGSKGGRPKAKESNKKPNKPKLTDGLNKKPKKPDTDTDTDTDTDIKEKELSFDEFYFSYPIKKSKDAARKKWQSMVNTERILAISGITGYIKSVPDGTNYCHPSTYLNNKRWEDEVSHNENNKRANTGSSRGLSAVERVRAATAINDNAVIDITPHGHVVA